MRAKKRAESRTRMPCLYTWTATTQMHATPVCSFILLPRSAKVSDWRGGPDFSQVVMLAACLTFRALQTWWACTILKFTTCKACREILLATRKLEVPQVCNKILVFSARIVRSCNCPWNLLDPTCLPLMPGHNLGRS